MQSPQQQQPPPAINSLLVLALRLTPSQLLWRQEQSELHHLLHHSPTQRRSWRGRRWRCTHARTTCPSSPHGSGAGAHAFAYWLQSTSSSGCDGIAILLLLLFIIIIIIIINKLLIALTIIASRSNCSGNGCSPVRWWCAGGTRSMITSCQRCLNSSLASECMR
jgi:hypothetical protein